MFRGGTASKQAKKVVGVDEVAIEELFVSLADPDDPESITADGIGNLCEMLEIDATADVRLLVLLWRLNASTKPGTVTKKEFTEGMKKIRKDNIVSLKEMLPSLDPGFLERSEFREFYRFVFQFSREGTHKTIEKDVVTILLSMVLDKNRAPHLDHFLEFLNGCSHQRITLDQWDSFLQFQHSVKLDLADYDEDGAWPLLLDEYVDWRKKTSGQK